ncbi:methylated-DNA--[protein]-cysteine S-methyltransferase [Sphingomonas prati]|uniref:Methylated-DNA--protein-cysteine methyltransferase n=1 Tax=Sphingomonas prati TaxID=1843237 RepID=A0A7W9BP49_9SPHN|nr:methylated-DNA--[protein]-cysteine S-methyltransferase [Sphingomonas prati]MBB5727552.1 methylated-DNA-[protein]-cysteine S-methyltransferase [Sphingomonas prati]GGE78836.1 methylated-DNA--protein-cysteine methyltransferase [Sphingomonas prati]
MAEVAVELVSRVVRSPVGALTLIASDAGLAAVLWPDDDPRRVRLVAASETVPHPLLDRAEAQLEDYFAGRATGFDVPLDLRGTAFQREVWAALRTIPYGKTRSYVAIARQIGRPDASRAVGAANGRNPVSIIVPCHRVVGSAGALTGFAGGMAVKARLLRLESGRGDLFD